LRVSDLIVTSDNAGQNSDAQEYFGGRGSAQACEIWTLANARPQTTKQFLCFFIITSILKVSSEFAT
jgi:hypothetical protein